MKNQSKTDNLYMDIADRASRESYCVRAKVGSVIVTPDLVTLVGYNGTVKGAENACELDNGTTDPSVIHAETNALAKALNAGVSTKGSTIYITLSPCVQCSKLIKQSGVVRVVYKEEYRCTAGIDFLRKHGVQVDKHRH
jgi:dCMP deaminase